MNRFVILTLNLVGLACLASNSSDKLWFVRNQT